MLTLVLGGQLPGDVRRLGGRRALLLPADRLLVRRRARRTPARRRSSSTASATAGFLLGVFLIFATFGSLDFREVAARGGDELPVETAQSGRCRSITLLLFIGATGKSAQIPLYVWLPDAMEGPTPVSRADPRRDDGHRGRLHGRPQCRPVQPTRRDHRGRRGRRRADGDLCRHDRPGADRHQAGARVFDGVPARLHVRRAGRGRVRGRRLPPDDARLLQGLPFPRLRLASSTRWRASRTSARWAA